MKMKKIQSCYPCAPEHLDSQDLKTREKRIDWLLDGFSKICSLLKWYVVVLLKYIVDDTIEEQAYLLMAPHYHLVMAP